MSDTASDEVLDEETELAHLRSNAPTGFSSTLAHQMGEGWGEGSGTLAHRMGEGGGEGSGTLAHRMGEGWGEGPWCTASRGPLSKTGSAPFSCSGLAGAGGHDRSG